MRYLFSQIKLIILCILFLSIYSKVFSQDLNKCKCCNHYDCVTNMYVAKFVEQMPIFPGGNDSLHHFFRKNFHYPNKQNNSLQSIITMGFVVDTNGNIKGGRIIGKCKNDLTLLDKEGLNILSLMPKWIPGKCNGEKVPVFISFKWRIEPQF